MRITKERTETDTQILVGGEGGGVSREIKFKAFLHQFYLPHSVYHPAHTLLVHPAEHLLSALTSADGAQPNYNQATHRIFFIATLPLKCFSHFLSLFVIATPVEAFLSWSSISFTLYTLLILLFEQEGY